jgi:hypothetical protein
MYHLINTHISLFNPYLTWLYRWRVCTLIIGILNRQNLSSNVNERQFLLIFKLHKGMENNFANTCILVGEKMPTSKYLTPGALFNPFTASCESAMTLSVPGVSASCEKFPHSSQLNFWSTESIFNQFSVFLKILNALCVCLQDKHPRSMKRVIRSDKPVSLLLLLWSHKCDFGAEPRSRIIATSAVKGLNMGWARASDCTG